MTGELKLNLDFKRKFSPTDMEDNVLLFKDSCSQSHTCADRIMGIQAHIRDKGLKPPSYDPRDILALVEKY